MLAVHRRWQRQAHQLSARPESPGSLDSRAAQGRVRTMKPFLVAVALLAARERHSVLLGLWVSGRVAWTDTAQLTVSFTTCGTHV